MAEQDPNGLDASTPGDKLDAGKLRHYTVLGAFLPAILALRSAPLDSATEAAGFCELLYTPGRAALVEMARSQAGIGPGMDLDVLFKTMLFTDAFLDVVRVGTFGAAKYTPDGWLSVPDGYRRYRDAAVRHYRYGSHEREDPESGLPHMAHLLWNILAALTIALRDNIE